MSAHVSIGVPVYKGEAFLEETLRSIQQQTHQDFDVLISMDGSDPVCEAICAPFLDDTRYRIVVQPERLGWVDNINWLMGEATGDFWYFHQQDDLTDPAYLATLLAHAQAHPKAAIAYSDMHPFGRVKGDFEQPASVTGDTPFLRQITMLHEQYPAFALRGLVRRDVLRRAGPMPRNSQADFGVDIVWLAATALFGELQRVPQPLYRKRYHDHNTESHWWTWERPKRLEAWSHHCLDMLNVALRVEGSAGEMRLLFLAAVERLTSPRAARFFLPVAGLTRDERVQLLDAFLDAARASAEHDIPVLLDSSWEEIERWSRGTHWLPDESPVEIVRYGPNPVHAGEPFNVQPDGGSSLWMRTSRRVAPGIVMQLGGIDLKTTLRGTLVTARVPVELVDAPGAVEVILIGPDGAPRSQPVVLDVLDPAGPPTPGNG